MDLFVRKIKKLSVIPNWSSNYTRGFPLCQKLTLWGGRRPVQHLKVQDFKEVEKEPQKTTSYK